MYVFRNWQGQKFTKTATAEMANFYRLVTGYEAVYVEPLPNIPDDSQEFMAKHIKWVVENNGRIQSIKLVCKLSGWGLKRSKDWVELVDEHVSVL